MEYHLLVKGCVNLKGKKIVVDCLIKELLTG